MEVIIFLKIAIQNKANEDFAYFYQIKFFTHFGSLGKAPKHMLQYLKHF